MFLFEKRRHLAEPPWFPSSHLTHLSLSSPRRPQEGASEHLSQVPLPTALQGSHLPQGKSLSPPASPQGPHHLPLYSPRPHLLSLLLFTLFLQHGLPCWDLGDVQVYAALCLECSPPGTHVVPTLNSSVWCLDQEGPPSRSLKTPLPSTLPTLLPCLSSTALPTLSNWPGFTCLFFANLPQ